MSVNQQNKNNEEEIDLASLFKLIGKGFSNFFNFIGNIFKEIFHFIILALIFLKSNAIKISLAIAIGAALGALKQINSNPRYASDLLVEPNFNSTKQLYNNVNYYNDLVKQQDTIGLIKTFNLSKEEAYSLKKFSIEPIVNDNDIINSYNSFIKLVDTTTVKSYSFKEFKNAFTDFDYKVHKINVTSEQNDVFVKLTNIIISSVTNNDYFKKFKELTNESLNRSDSVYRKNLVQLDSLRKVYMQVMIEEAKKEFSGTNIDMGVNNTKAKELELFQKNKDINSDLRNIALEKAKKYDIINIISNFQPVGYQLRGITKNYISLFGIAGGGLMILFLLLMNLNKFLNNYKK